MRRIQLEDVLHIAVLAAIAVYMTGCGSTPKPKGFEMPPALSEVYRNGQLKGLEQADSADLGMPNQYDRVSHTCVSTPIYNLAGYYVRTDVRCW